MPVEVEAKVVGVASNDGAAVEVDASADSEGNEVPLPSGHDGGARDRDSKSCNRMAKHAFLMEWRDQQDITALQPKQGLTAGLTWDFECAALECGHE